MSVDGEPINSHDYNSLLIHFCRQIHSFVGTREELFSFAGGILFQDPNAISANGDYETRANTYLQRVISRCMAGKEVICDVGPTLKFSFNLLYIPVALDSTDFNAFIQVNTPTRYLVVETSDVTQCSLCLCETTYKFPCSSLKHGLCKKCCSVTIAFKEILRYEIDNIEFFHKDILPTVYIELCRQKLENYLQEFINNNANCPQCRKPPMQFDLKDYNVALQIYTFLKHVVKTNAKRRIKNEYKRLVELLKLSKEHGAVALQNFEKYHYLFN